MGRGERGLSPFPSPRPPLPPYLAPVSPALTIDRCVCRATPFADLLPQARAAGWTLEDLARETGCGAQCGLCRPYLRRMLATGETAFHELLTDPPGRPAPHPATE